MNLYSAEQIRDWDAFTIAHEPVSSINLMQRAASACVHWLQQHAGTQNTYIIMCGKGNNGGDGLAIARLLHKKGVPVTVYILDEGNSGSADFEANLKRLLSENIQPHYMRSTADFPFLDKHEPVIDALFGTGVNRPLDSLAAQLAEHLNAASENIISIDVPSGLQMQKSSIENTVVRARYTLSFQSTKMAFLLAENEVFTGQVFVLEIGLHPRFAAAAPYILIDMPLVQQIYKPRSPFGHKGSYGHVLMVGGTAGKIGALVLSAKAALRAGAGLVSALAPKLGYHVLQTAVPEAMCITDEGEEVLTAIQLDTARFSAIGVGPGMGTAPETVKAFSVFVSRLEQLVVVDADALNCLAQDTSLLSALPKGSVLTPHPKEFDRLFGLHANDFERIEKAQQMAQQFGLYIVLKGHHTFIATPEGAGYFNSTGNAGMATGGSGDVLTGIITALLAQGYSSLHACILGVYLHGLSGDRAVMQSAEEALIASDIIDHLGAAFNQVKQ